MIRILFFLTLMVFHSLAVADVIKIGVRAHKGSETAASRWLSTADYLHEKIPQHDFQIVPFELIENMETAVANDELHFVITHPVAYVDLEIQHGASRMLTLVRKNDLKHFSSIIFTRADNPDIFTIGDLKGKTFGAVAPKGLGGWLMAKREMLQHGLVADEELAALVFLTRQQRIVEAVIVGDIEAGTVRTGILDEYLLLHNIPREQIRIINPKTTENFPYLYSTDIYPEWVFAKTAHDHQDLAEKVSQVLLSMPAGHPASIKGNYERWTIPVNYQKVHELMRELQVGSYSSFEQFDLPAFVKKYYLYFFIIVLVFLLHSYYSLRTRFLNAELQSEIEQKNKLLKKLQQMATRDDLTGLPNRKLTFQMFRKELMQSKRTGNQLALLFIDLVGFKEINERYGHVQGDVLLRNIGEVFEKLIRGNDLAGRVGGDEFLVLLGDVSSADDARVVANKLIEQISRVEIANISQTISANIGVLVFVADESSTVESMLSAADNLLQQARLDGRGQYRLLDMTMAANVVVQ